MAPQVEKSLKQADEAAKAYALKTTNAHHAKVMLSIAKQYKSEPAYIQRLEAHVAELHEAKQ